MADPESLVRFAELLKLRSLAASTQFGYMKVLRRLAGRVGRDPAGLDEAEVRAHVLHLKEQRAYSPSSIRTAVAALRVYYGLHLGRDWKLFDLVRSPDRQRLPQVLTRAEVARLFAVIREERFRVVLRLIYACGLRVGEAVNLEVGDLRGGERVRIRQARATRTVTCPCRDGCSLTCGRGGKPIDIRAGSFPGWAGAGATCPRRISPRRSSR